MNQHQHLNFNCRVWESSNRRQFQKHGFSSFFFCDSKFRSAQRKRLYIKFNLTLDSARFGEFWLFCNEQVWTLPLQLHCEAHIIWHKQSQNEHTREIPFSYPHHFARFPVWCWNQTTWICLVCRQFNWPRSSRHDLGEWRHCSPGWDGRDGDRY